MAKYEGKNNDRLRRIMGESAARMQNRVSVTTKIPTANPLKNQTSVSNNTQKRIESIKSPERIGQKNSTAYQQMKKISAGENTTKKRNSWEFKPDGTRKSFNELTTPEVLTWIGTLPEEERGSAARDFETNYLKNPGSTRYDPYYTDYSNNDEARSLFGVNTFDQKWIDDNRGYANYLTFSGENYTTPKKPGANASEEEKRAYQWWQIANTYEATTRAAENEYAQLRGEIQEMARISRKSGDRLTADEILAGIDWGDYETLENLREASAAGNGRYLNRPVQVGDASLRSMVNAALRGEDVTEARDFVYGESEYLKNSAANEKYLLQDEPEAQTPAQSRPQAAQISPYADVTSDKYDPYYGEGSNNTAARELFGVDVFDQNWIEDNRGLMAYIKFKDEDDTEPVKPGEDATEQEKAAYEYWKIANTYEETTRKAENELKTLQGWMEKQAEKLGEAATADEILDRIDWEDEDWQDEYPTLYNMREVAAAGNARLVNRPVGAGDESLRRMAEKIVNPQAPAEDPTADAETLPNSANAPEATENEQPLESAENKSWFSLPDPNAKGKFYEENQAAYDRIQEANARLKAALTDAESIEKHRTQAEAGGYSDEIKYMISVNGLPLTIEWAKKKLASFKTYEELGMLDESMKAQRDEMQKQLDLMNIQRGKELEKYSPAEGQAVDAAVSAASQGGTVGELLMNSQLGPKETEQVNTVTVNPVTAADETAAYRSEYGLTGAKTMTKRMLDYYNELEMQGALTDAHAALRDEWQAEYDRLLDDEAEREEIEQRVRADFLTAGYSKWNPLTTISEYFFMDALKDAEFVPTEDYEEYLRYRRNAANVDNPEEMAKYNRLGPVQERLSLLAEGVATGMDKAATATTRGLEHVLYTIARWDPATKDMTKDEVYASDRFLAALKGWNEQFDKEYIDEETKAELTEEYPVVALVSAGVSEMIKMVGQSIGDPLAMVGGHSYGVVAFRAGFQFLQNNGIALNTINKLGRYAANAMPFALDVYGSTYETAISEGATENQAAGAAALNGLFTGSISSWVTGRLTKPGGWLTRLFTSRAGQKAAEQGAIAAAKSGKINAILGVGRRLLESAIEEGMEEAIEVPIEGLIAKGVYDWNRAWTGEGGILDAKAMAESGIAGAVAGSMFTLTAGASGLMGKAAQTEAERILEKAENGEKIEQSEIDNLEKIEAREASIQDKAEEILQSDTGAIDAAEEKVNQAGQKAGEAEKQLAEAQENKAKTVQAVQPTLDALNEGTASYQNPEIPKAINDARKQMQAATEQSQAAENAVSDARAEYEQMTAERDQTLQQVQEAARAQATQEVEAELQAEAEAETQALAEAEQEAANEPETPGVKWIAKAQKSQLSADQRTQINILHALGEQYGVEIDIVDTLGPGRNGMYAGGRRVTVALDATENAYVQVGVHEMVHYIRGMDQDAYTVLEGVVESQAAGLDIDLNTLVQQRMDEYAGTQALSEEDAREEVIAEIVPQVLTNEESARVLVEQNKTLAQKIRDFFIDFTRKLKSIGERYAARNDRGEALMFEGNTEALTEIADVLDKALMVAGRAEGKKTQVERLNLKSDEETAELIEETKAEEKAEALDEAARIANQTVKKYKSTISRGDVAAEIDQMIDAYQNHDDAAAEQIADRLAKKVIEQSTKTDTSHQEGYEEIRRRLREKGFSLTDTQKQETANRYGSYNDWRKSIMGSVKIRNDAASLDAIWGELSGKHPDYFPADANEAQMPEYIEEFVRAMKPRYENRYGMDAASAAADLSRELQADVMEAVSGEGRAEKAAQLRADSETYRENIRVQTEERRAQARQKRADQFQQIARQIKAGREAGDDTAVQNALAEYRKMMGGKSHAADAIDAGIEARRLRQEIRRITGIIENYSEMISGEDSDFDREKLSDQRKSYTELREQLQRQEAALHRQEVLERAGIPDDDTDPDAEALLAGEMQKRMDEDMGEVIIQRTVEMRGRVNGLWDRMKEKMKDFNQTSTISREDLIETFQDLEGEIIQHSEMAKVWERRSESYKAQLFEENNELSYLRKELRTAKAKGDEASIATLQGLILEAEDRTDVLGSQIRNAEAQAKYSRRIGAVSLDKALSEGRLPEPIMERIIGLCRDAGRRGAFNQNALVKAGEAIRLNTTTAARVYDDLFGDAAPLMRAIYYDPVMDNETDRQRWIKQWRDRISALKLTKEQSALVQEIGEGRLNPQDARYQQADQTVLDAVRVFRQFYDEAHALASNALVRNGYERPGKITDYFPHIETQKTFWDKLGIPIENTSLPTSINGLTDTFTPGRQYSGHLEHRYGEKTDYDALFGFEQYIGGISNVIYHTDDIQRHRQLETEIRSAAKRGLFDGGQRSEHLSEFVKWIHEYTNLLAGKKSWVDRPFEGTAGRAIYSAATRLKSMKGASAVCGNLASAVTNMVPVAQVLAEKPLATVKGVIQMCMGVSNGRGSIPESQYKIRKLGSDSVVQTMYTRFTHFASRPFEWVDLLATNIVVNAYYQDNLQKGMDSETAMRSADSKAARLMGDRSKGAMPNIYGSQILGFFTQFQLEVANQSQHFRKDLIRAGGAKKAMVTLLASALTGYIWNEFNEWLTGRRPAADPFQIGMDVYQTWKNDGSPMEIGQAAYNGLSELFPYSNLGGRVAAFDGIGTFIEALTTEGNDGEDVRYALMQLGYGIVPGGGQLKKIVTGTKAQIDDGYYNTSRTQLRYALPDWRDDPLTTAQMILFGPSSTKAARDYYDGTAPGLTTAQTRNYEQARKRGATSTEAYRNEADKAAAARLESEISKTENAIEDAEAQARAGMETPEIDTSEIEQQRADAAQMRSEAMPGDELTDFWWQRKDEPQVQAGIELWRKTGKTWALPYAYTANKSYTIDSRKEILGSELLKEAEEMYEEGYMEIMEGVDPNKLGDEELAELEEMLEDLKAEVNSKMKKRIRQRNKENE